MPARGRVEFRDVEFRYPHAEEPVLSGISFTAEPGETVAIVGSTGCGKSTLISLIPRFYDVTAGSVLVDGVDVREFELTDLWRRIGLVPQKSFLFSGTVAGNLRHGDADASDEELWHVLETAQGRDFVAEMPEQLEAAVAQGGASVSGGQRQRLAIARALAKRAPINIFDDSFSALDFTTDARLRAALKKEMAEATVIIVAQRVGTIMHADRIIVLEDGTIAAMGTHDAAPRDQRRRIARSSPRSSVSTVRRAWRERRRAARGRAAGGAWPGRAGPARRPARPRRRPARSRAHDARRQAEGPQGRPAPAGRAAGRGARADPAWSCCSPSSAWPSP